MIERVKAFILAHDLIKPTDKVLVAVSGGVDSMVLINVLHYLDFNIAVAHMNYQLRGEESDLDEELVKRVCKEMGVECFVKRSHISCGESVQIEARRRRYEWFNEIVEERNIDKIATAHHLNDSLETVLLNLAKGTGIMGVSGIPYQNTQIVRPLLNETRADIEAFAKTEGIQWREDASNQESKYQRNLIRNKVLPLLEKINPSMVSTFRSTQERMIGVRQLVVEELDDLRRKFIQTVNKSTTIDLKWMGTSERDLMMLSELIKEYGVSYALAKEIFQSKQSGSQFATSSHVLHMDRQKLIIKANGKEESSSVWIRSAGDYVCGDVAVGVSEIKPQEIDETFPSNLAFLDGAKVSFPIQVRSWQLGDEFQPFGMSGKKKLSNFFIDEKIPVSAKRSIPVFVQNDQIIWVGGYRIDDRFKVTSETQSVIKIELESGS